MNFSKTKSKYDNIVKPHRFEDLRLRETHLPRQHKQSDEENKQWHRAHGLQILKNTWLEGALEI